MPAQTNKKMETEIIKVSIDTYEYAGTLMHGQHDYLIELYWIDREKGILGAEDADKEYENGRKHYKKQNRCTLTAQSGAGISLDQKSRPAFCGLAEEFLTEAKEIQGSKLYKIKEVVKELGFSWNGKTKTFSKNPPIDAVMEKSDVRLANMNFNGKAYGSGKGLHVYVENKKVPITQEEWDEYIALTIK